MTNTTHRFLTIARNLMTPASRAAEVAALAPKAAMSTTITDPYNRGTHGVPLTREAIRPIITPATRPIAPTRIAPPAPKGF